MLGAICTGLMACPGKPTPDEQPPVSSLDSQTVAAIDDRIDALLETSTASGYALAIWRGGEVVFAKGYGTKAPGGAAVTNSTRFQIGSDTKKLTALTLLAALDDAGLSVDTRVVDIDPSFTVDSDPEAAAQLTVRQLLSHQSGLYDYTPWSHIPDDEALGDIIATSWADNTVFMMPPGTGYEYSNPNYAIAGHLTELLTNSSWADAVEAAVVHPLGLEHTHLRLRDTLAATDDLASGFGDTSTLDTHSLLEQFSHEPDVDWVSPAEHVDNAFTRPAGLAWSTATDHVRVLGALMERDARLLSPALHDEMQRLQAPTYGILEQVGPGLGLFREEPWLSRDGRLWDTALLSHGGATNTMRSVALALPEYDLAIALVGNSGSDTDIDLAGAELLALLAAEHYRAAPAVTPPAPASDLTAYAGSFVEPQLGEAVIEHTDGELQLTIPLLAAFDVPATMPLVPLALNLFVFELAGQTFELAFYDGDTELQYASNRQFAFTRVAAP